MDVLKRNNVKKIGSGRKVLMFGHGFGCDQNVWRHIVSSLKPYYCIVLFDHVGAGKSDLTAYDRNKYSSLQGYADDVIEIIDALELEEVSYVGHSVGATIGMLAVVKDAKKFHKLVMIGPSPRYLNDLPEYIGGFEKEYMDQLLNMMDNDYIKWSETIAPVIMGNAERPELGRELTENFCSNDPEIAKHFGRVTFLSDHREAVSNIKVPTLILQCSEDVIAPLEVGKYLADNIPVSTLRVMQATGHCPHLSYPEETIEAIQFFV